MAETARLGLPLVQAAQAQKHVTVNEALGRLDAVVQLVLTATEDAVPPEPASGVYGVPEGATGAWAGRAGQVAFASAGGWEFVTPARGWTAVVANRGPAVFDGAAWIEGAATLAPSGAGLSLRTVEVDHVPGIGAASTTGAIIPAQSLVFGVTGRVIEALGAGSTTFALGIAGESPDRYGSGYGVQAGAWLRGLTSSPLAYYAPTPLTLTAAGGAFTGGRVRLSVHLAELRLPGV
jgi:hypothetical protein